MRLLALAGACLLLPACGSRIPLDLCKHAALRRQGYTLTIAGIDAYARGQLMPAEMVLGREAAATALSILDLNCPQPAR